ncbi:CDP-alcohol phosphatidyltransferase family protein [Candidatus Uabimicrobium amorphum]|uniref:CDP-alcohol phosphatidyltransferase n=1 Tax=Uabimicrobium amorphum TaxID=2596890 RepID=A0A5S9F5J1_UABAM|nr:CDP-alcohol phosphatidyltransferase family protein [Candidatus Uabimicrobium amorphum]BBM85624.1 hypothetical protein UABAM_03998 [Candidatus Uabimicrobium amorphum]
MENYEYNVVEKSLTQDFMIKWVWMPFVKSVPKGVTPNMLTYIGLIFVTTMMLGVWAVALGHSWGLIVAAVSTFLYMLCDNTDGLLARSTGQTSRLGEFLDHWLDSISFVLVDSCIAYSLGLTGMWFFLFVTLLTLAFYITMWEHHYTGVFFSGHLGSNERMFVYIALYFCVFFLGDSSWLTFSDNSFANIPMILFILVAIGSVLTTLGCIVRVKKHFLDVILFTIAIATVGLWSYCNLLAIHWVVALLTVINMIFCGKLIKMHLTQTPSPYRYKILTIAIPLCIALPFIASWSNIAQYVVYTAVTCMAVTALWDGLFTIRYLKKQ